ncbi:MAG: hypothetical protein AAFY72_19125 [Cyanobacteria bacterium J06649_4]
MPYVTSFERIAEARGREEGREKGREEGRQEGLLRGLKIVLKLIFGEQGLQFAADLENVSDIAVLEAIEAKLDPTSETNIASDSPTNRAVSLEELQRMLTEKPLSEDS